MSKLRYCDKKLSNSGTCSRLAAYSCTATSKAGNTRNHLRCFEHRFTPTVHSIVDRETVKEFNQSTEIEKVSEFLRSFIGKEVHSKWHRTIKPFIGVYIKNNGSIMCKDHKDQWRLVFYHQITNNEYQGAETK